MGRSVEFIALYKKHLTRSGYCTPPGRVASALESAKTEERFRELERRGLVRLWCEPEDTYWGDSTDLEEGSKEWKEMAAYVEAEGYWIWFGQWRQSEDDRWEFADNIGGIFGDDLQDYEIDLMGSAIDGLENEWKSEAEELASRGTYAAGGFHAER